MCIIKCTECSYGQTRPNMPYFETSESFIQFDDKFTEWHGNQGYTIVMLRYWYTWWQLFHVIAKHCDSFVSNFYSAVFIVSSHDRFVWFCNRLWVFPHKIEIYCVSFVSYCFKLWQVCILFQSFTVVNVIATCCDSFASYFYKF